MNIDRTSECLYNRERLSQWFEESRKSKENLRAKKILTPISERQELPRNTKCTSFTFMCDQNLPHDRISSNHNFI